MLRLTAVVLFALLGTACGDSSTPTTPTIPATPSVTETFTGTLTRSGGATHPFVVSRSGAVNVTLTSLGPNSTIVVGLSLGTWNGNACQVVLAKDNAVQGSTVLGTASTAGNLCVRIYDVGNLTSSLAYEISVVHP